LCASREKLRTVTVLAGIEEHDIYEVGLLLDLPQGTVKSRSTLDTSSSGDRRRTTVKHYIQRSMAIALIGLMFVSLGMAQAPAPAQTQTPAPVKSSVLLKVQVVISRYEADRKVSSLPYTLAVTANEKPGGSIRMGSMIPVPNGPGSYNLQNVGTNIDCSVLSMEDARYKVEIGISDTSVMERRGPEGVPTLRSFVTNNSVVLKDGQSAQFTAAADKNTGEIVKVDVTLTVDK
jgi:hypothetical protein